MLITTKLNIDMQRNVQRHVVNVVQNDTNTRAVEFRLFSDCGRWIVPDGVTAALSYSKPDGTSGIYDKLPDGADAFTITSEAVTVILAPQMLTVPGEVRTALVLTESNSDQLSTFPFVVNVAESPNPGKIVSENYCYYTNLDAINAAINELKQAVGGNGGGTGGGSGSDSGQNPTETSIFAGKTASFYGDSLTEKNGHYTKGYHSWVKELLELASYNNYGTSGYTLADILTRMQRETDNPDIVFVMGGTNNQRAVVATPLGKLGDTDASTIYGQLYMLCDYAKRKYVAQPIVFITPHFQTAMQSSQKITAYQISIATLEVCRMFAIPVYDNYSFSGMYKTNMSIWTDDNCHWNDFGHEMVGKNLAKFVSDSFRYLYDGEVDNGGTDEPEATLSSISATYTGGDVAVGTAVNALTGVVVTAHYSDGTSEPVTGYILSGTIAEGSNTITVSYGGKTTTFTVTGIAESGGEEEPDIVTYTVTNALTNVTTNNSATTAEENTAYTATLTAAKGYTIDTVTVTMGGADITATAYADGVVTIASVTGDVVITAKATEIYVELKAYNVTVKDGFLGYLVESSNFSAGDTMTTEHDESNMSGLSHRPTNVSIFTYNSVDDFKAGTYAATDGGAYVTFTDNHAEVSANVTSKGLAYPYLWLPIAYNETGTITLTNCAVLCNDRRVPIIAAGSWKGTSVFEEIPNE